MQPPKGESRDVSIIVRPYPNGVDAPKGFRWMLRDISQRKWAEQALEQERSFLEGVISTAEAAIMVIDGNDRIVRINPFLRELTEMEWNEICGRHWSELLLGEADWAAAKEMVSHARQADAVKGPVLNLISRSGIVHPVVWSARALRAHPDPDRVVLVGFHIAELKEAQDRALQIQRLAAIGEFVTGLAHESRNALQRSQACLSLIGLRMEDNPDVLNLVERAQDAQNDLQWIYETVREYAAPIRLELQSCRVPDLWRSVWGNLGRLTNEAHLQERIATDIACLCSPFHLKQVFRNLLENALSAGGHPPMVEVAYEEGELDASPAVKIAVRDNGTGFSETARLRAFQPFNTTKARGTGLGLSICRRIVEAHGGRIEINPLIRGSEIVVTLPRR